MTEPAKIKWLIDLITDGRTGESGHKGLRLKDVVRDYRFTYSDGRECDVYAVVNAAVRKGLLIAVDVEYWSRDHDPGNRIRSGVARADFVSIVGPDVDPILYLPHRIPRPVEARLRAVRKILDRALRAKDAAPV